MTPEKKNAQTLGSLPSAADMERGVLSCMLQAPDFAILPACDLLKEADFSVPACGIIFGVIVQLAQSGAPVDLLAVQQIIMDRHQLEEVGGAFALSDILTFSATPSHVQHYASAVREKAAQRRLVQAAWSFVDHVMAEPEGWKDHTAELVNVCVAEQTGMAKRATIVPIRDAIMGALDQLENAVSNRGHVTRGFATGFTDLDRCFMGLARGDNVVIAGRPSMGKTALVVNFLENMGMGEGHYREFYDDAKEWPGCEKPRQGKLKTLMVCLESSSVQIASRMLMGRSRVSLIRIRDGLLGQDDFRNITRSASALAASPMQIWDAAGISVEELEMELKAYKSRNPDLAVVAVDHCGLLLAKGIKHNGNDYIRCSYISSKLRLLWPAIDVVGMPLWQLSRDVEKRASKLPLKSDLRDSGKIEEDATHVIMPFRPSYYDESVSEDEALVVVAKNRDGPTKADGIEVKWTGEFTKFSSTHDRLLSNRDDQRQAH